MVHGVRSPQVFKSTTTTTVSDRIGGMGIMILSTIRITMVEAGD